MNVTEAVTVETKPCYSDSREGDGFKCRDAGWRDHSRRVAIEGQ